MAQEYQRYKLTRMVMVRKALKMTQPINHNQNNFQLIMSMKKIAQIKAETNDQEIEAEVEVSIQDRDRQAHHLVQIPHQVNSQRDSKESSLSKTSK